MVLHVKELVEIVNMRAADVQSAPEQKEECKVSRWYVKEGTTLGARFRGALARPGREDTLTGV
jgi:hypothetical protein